MPIRNYLRRCELTPDQRSDALALAWYDWSVSKKVFSARALARWAVRKVRKGRTLPGCQTPQKDALGHNRPWQGGAMAGVADGADGPAKVAADYEMWSLFLASLDARYLRILRLILQGLSNHEVAECMDVTPGAISYSRRVLWLRYAECE